MLKRLSSDSAALVVASAQIGSVEALVSVLLYQRKQGGGFKRSIYACVSLSDLQRGAENIVVHLCLDDFRVCVQADGCKQLPLQDILSSESTVCAYIYIYLYGGHINECIHCIVFVNISKICSISVASSKFKVNIAATGNPRINLRPDDEWNVAGIECREIFAQVIYCLLQTKVYIHTLLNMDRSLCVESSLIKTNAYPKLSQKLEKSRYVIRV